MLRFEPLDGDTGLVFRVASASASRCFGGGRCSAYPQNDSTAATLANDKYFTARILERAGLATLSGQYFFLHARYRAHRPSGHERADAMAYFEKLGGRAFAKPLNGSRGDFARPLDGVDALTAYMDEVAAFYDAILIQPFVRGDEYRVFLLDTDVVYVARKSPPYVTGDGARTLRALIADRDRALDAHGLSGGGAALEGDRVLAAGERFDLPGRMNRSAGGAMAFATPPRHDAALTLARRAVAALGLRAAAVDLFTGIDGDPDAMAVIEINANPSIRFLEDSGRDDLILRIWRHTFTAIGLLHV